MKGDSRTVYFATANKGKFDEAASLTKNFGVELKHLNVQKQEIQSNDLRRIASFAVEKVAQGRRAAVVSEDAGLFINALNGFPGPYSSYAFNTIGLWGILRLIGESKNRKAFFEAALAYSSPRTNRRIFSGIVKGAVARKPRGLNGFGFDPIFIPEHGRGRTFAEMSTDEKNALPSHRALAFSKFCRWFTIN